MNQEELNERENQRALVRDAVRQVLAEQVPVEVTMRQVFQDAINEWMNQKFREFGKWSFKSIGVAALGALAYFVFVSKGWTPPH